MQYLQYLCGTTNDTGLLSATHRSIELRSPGFIITHHKIEQNSAIQYALDAVYVQAQVHNRHTVAQIQQHCDVNQVAWARFNQACILGFIVHTTRSTLLVYNITKVAVLIDLSLLLALILTVVPTTFALIWKHTGTITKSVLQPICSSRDLVRLTKLVWCREWWNPVPLDLI